jgi:sulfite exporter TauE/SafE
MGIELLITGFLLGAVSSFHCVGMCGPIALALPVHFLPAHQKATGIILYNAGRIFVYASLGFVFGFLGRQVYLGGMQQGLSIVLGGIMLLYFLQSLLRKKFLHITWADTLTHQLQKFITRYMQKKKLYGMFILGAACCHAVWFIWQ